MALKNRKEDHLFMSYQEAKSGNENAPQTYVETTARFESRGIMTLPEPTRMYEDDTGKLGTGQHGLQGDLMAIGTPFSISGIERLSELAYWLSFVMGKAGSVNLIASGVYSHLLDMLGEASLAMPTFTMEHGNASANFVHAGNVINDCSITIPFNSGNGKIDATFNGWGNHHYPSSGVLTKMTNGTMSSAAESITSEPLVSGKCCQAWIASALEDDFGQTSVDFTDEDLGSSLVEITSLVNSITFTINNGMSLESTLRGGGSGVVNDWTRGVPTITLELNLRKNVSTADFRSFCLANNQKAIEILFQGPMITGAYPYAMDLFFPVVEFRGTTEDDETPTSQTLPVKVFEDTNGYAFRALFQTAIDEAYNAVAP